MQSREINFDGLVGPTHNYAGLSAGNVASQKNAKKISNPKKAALEGLDKAWSLSQMGITQGILPPHMRPLLSVLRDLGFAGEDHEIIKRARQNAPEILNSVYSASAMWAANSATVSPSIDCIDGRVHFTVANLSNRFHRSIEADQTFRTLKAIFPDPNYFAVHPPLARGEHFGDEGAANHNRLSNAHGETGHELFIYGKSSFDPKALIPAKFPARQSKEASESVARRHGLKSVLFAQQNPTVVDAGVFHNDVICLANENVFFFHENAFINKASLLEEIKHKFRGSKLHLIEVKASEVSVAEAVETYLFNGQLITLPSKKMALILPSECSHHPKVKNYVEEILVRDNPIAEAKFFDVKESMQNGGGPACLRLRVVLTEEELQKVHPGVILTETLYQSLVSWVKKHYRDRLKESDLADPLLPKELTRALSELVEILSLPHLYSCI